MKPDDVGYYPHYYALIYIAMLYRGLWSDCLEQFKIFIRNFLGAPPKIQNLNLWKQGQTTSGNNLCEVCRVL